MVTATACIVPCLRHTLHHDKRALTIALGTSLLSRPYRNDA